VLEYDFQGFSKEYKFSYVVLSDDWFILTDIKQIQSVLSRQYKISCDLSIDSISKKKNIRISRIWTPVQKTIFYGMRKKKRRMFALLIF
jgi:hypothetical protein